MNAITVLRGPAPIVIGAQSSPDLIDRIDVCAANIARLDADLDRAPTMSPRYAAISDQLDAWRDHQTAIKAELVSRFRSQFGCDAWTFAEIVS